MWCETEVKKALCFIPGYTGFCPEYSQQMGKSYGQQTHHLMRENQQQEGRLSGNKGRPCLRVEMRPDKMERGDSDYERCSTCTYERGATCDHRYVRPAGLSSEEMWRTMDLEGKRERDAKGQKTQSSPKKYYSRHKSHFPSYYPHYEGYSEVHDHSHSRHGHYDDSHYGHDDDSQYGHGHHKHKGSFSHKHKKDNPVSVSICILPRKPKGKFHVPSVCGDYDLEKNKICVQLSEKHNRKSERYGDRMSYHDKAHAKSDRDRSEPRYQRQETRSSNRDRKSHCKPSARNGPMPHCHGFITGVFCTGDETFGNSSGRLWRGNCC